MGAKAKDPLLKNGTVLNGRWEILEYIAKGGKGEVYCARQVNLDREVVVKTISREFIESFEGDQEEIQAELDRFRREVLIMAQVRHPNVLQVYDYEKAIIPNDGEEPLEYIVMEYIPGPTLRSVMPTEGVGENDKRIAQWIRRFFFPVLEAMESIHSLGIVHRDIKPENILLDGEVPKIMDFGLAGGPKWHSVTRSHHVIGTIPYMAGEQFLDMAGADVRADVYSLGKILYEAVSGKMTKETAEPFKTARLSRPSTSFLKRLDEIIQGATAEERERRTPSVQALKEALAETLKEFGLLPGLGEKAIRKLRVAAIALLLLAAGSVGFHVLYHREREARLSTRPESRDIPMSSQTGAMVPASPDESRRKATPTTIKGKDGAIMHLVPGGEVRFPENYGTEPEGAAQVALFYMDETQVTNLQFVEFLNKVLAKISVEGTVVKGGEGIWLFLGEVLEGYEPILFEKGGFHVSNPAHAACPVLRVTPYGAAAYAAYYDKRLPQEAEWLLAAASDSQSPRSQMHKSFWLGPGTAHAQHGHMHQQPQADTERAGPPRSGVPARPAPSTPPGLPQTKSPPAPPPLQAPVLGPGGMPLPVLNFPQNALGLRGLKQGVSEWAVRAIKAQPDQEKTPLYLIMPGRITRQAWEGFEEVGFRGVVSVADYHR